MCPPPTCSSAACGATSLVVFTIVLWETSVWYLSRIVMMAQLGVVVEVSLVSESERVLWQLWPL